LKSPTKDTQKKAEFLLLLRFTYGIRFTNNFSYFLFRLIYKMTEIFLYFYFENWYHKKAFSFFVFFYFFY
jgi:hypothetical protein